MPTSSPSTPISHATDLTRAHEHRDRGGVRPAARAAAGEPKEYGIGEAARRFGVLGEPALAAGDGGGFCLERGVLVVGRAADGLAPGRALLRVPLPGLFGELFLVGLFDAARSASVLRRVRTCWPSYP